MFGSKGLIKGFDFKPKGVYNACMKMIHCRICGYKPETDFYKDRTRSSGYNSICKYCANLYHRSWTYTKGVKPRQPAQIRTRETAREYEKLRRKISSTERAKTARRRAMRLKATPSWSETNLIKELYEQAREMSLNGIRYHVDHIIPPKSKTVCGLHVLSNLQILTESANLAKSNTF